MSLFPFFIHLPSKEVRSPSRVHFCPRRNSPQKGSTISSPPQKFRPLPEFFFFRLLVSARAGPLFQKEGPAYISSSPTVSFRRGRQIVLFRSLCEPGHRVGRFPAMARAGSHRDVLFFEIFPPCKFAHPACIDVIYILLLLLLFSLTGGAKRPCRFLLTREMRVTPSFLPFFSQRNFLRRAKIF